MPRLRPPSGSRVRAVLALLASVLSIGAGSAFSASLVNAATRRPCDFTLDACPDTANPKILLFRYDGLDCSATHHSQNAGSVTCSGNPALAAPVRILFTDRSDPNDAGARKWFDGIVPLGGEFIVDAQNAGASNLADFTYGYVYSGATLLQSVKFETSCSSPLKEGDRFGSLVFDRPRFPRIPVWAIAGAYQDSTNIRPRRCAGSFAGPLPDSIREQPRAITVRFLRDRKAEAREDFGGYRVYRVTNEADTLKMMLIRRFSRQISGAGADTVFNWHFSVVDRSDPTKLPLLCNGEVMHDSIVTFVDPDSSGNWVKVCRFRSPQSDPNGTCTSRGDSVLILVPPPGPHDGFRTWYAVTYEGQNLTADAAYADLFVPDTVGIIGPCGVPGDHNTCPNLNNKCYNMTSIETEPTRGPTANLERVGVVPNPFRAREAWDRAGANELHIINLPSKATIRIYTAAGDLVARLEHNDRVRDFERWNLKNQNGRDVASGIYILRVESDIFTFQDRFIVIR